MRGSDTPDNRVEGPEHFASVLNTLFRTRLKTTEDGRMRAYKLREVAQGTGISIGYLSDARRGNIDNPSLEKILLLAKFFGVSPRIFVEPSEPAPPPDAPPPVAERPGPKEKAMQQIAFRAEGFSEVELGMVREMMDVIERWRPKESERASGEQSHNPDRLTDPATDQMVE